MDDLQGQRFVGLDFRDGDVPEEDRDYHSREDDESDAINAATSPEVRAFLQRISDGNISDWERVEAAMPTPEMTGGEF